MKKLFGSAKAKVSALIVATFSLVAMSSASAAPVADQGTVDAIKDGMTGIQLTALATVGAVAGIAVLLFAAPFAWRYGKKIFQTVAR